MGHRPPPLTNSFVFVLRPNYELMRQAYNDYLTRPHYGICPVISHRAGPDREGNNCAVRMSVALWRANSVTLDYFASDADDRWNRNKRRVHYLYGRHCGLDVPHVQGAAELAAHIRSVWGRPFEEHGPSNAASAIAGRRGVVYFENCFRRAGDPRDPSRSDEWRGDHIDLWDGREFWNIKLGKSAGGGGSPDAPLFRRSNRVWFFPLS